MEVIGHAWVAGRSRQALWQVPMLVPTLVIHQEGAHEPARFTPCRMGTNTAGGGSPGRAAACVCSAEGVQCGVHVPQIDRPTEHMV